MKLIFTALVLGLMLNAHPVLAQDLDYTVYADVLDAYVNDQGRVNYKELKENSEKLEAFIAVIEQTDVSSLNDVEQKNFWINAYNAITLKTVVDAYPVKGIRRINFGLVWEKRRKVAGTKKSLGHIEHKILRPLGDPRIHFAINCASGGCPKLPNKPFLSAKLDEQLDFETRRFINDSEKVKLDREKNILYYSAIFDWFEEDFLVEHDSILSYVKQYINDEDKAYLENNTVKTKVLKYDWALNEQK